MPICLHLGKQTSAFMTSKNNLSEILMSQELYWGALSPSPYVLLTQYNIIYYLRFNQLHWYIRVAACKDWEISVNEHIWWIAYILSENTLWWTLLKIIFKSSSEFLILRDCQKFQNAVKVRFQRFKYLNQAARTKNRQLQTVKITSIQMILRGFISPGRANWSCKSRHFFHG